MKEFNKTNMMAVVTLENGGFDKLSYQEAPIPQLEPGEVLVKVLAAGVNNTEINTRLGWYSSSVEGSTDKTSGQQEDQASQKKDGGWNEETPFPFIQGTDACGTVVKVSSDNDSALMSQRVLIRPCMRPNGFSSPDNIWMASDFDGAFAQYVKVPASEVFPIKCDWTDVELASIPCAYGTSENMVHRAKVCAKDTVLVTGASGGVGSATIQLAKRRGAKVIAICGATKVDQVKAIGADIVLTREQDLASTLAEESVTVIIDNVAGPQFPTLMKILQRGGRYASSGAIAGPIVSLDMRDFYLKDLSLIGCTGWDEPVFPNLVSYIEAGEIKPLVAKTYELQEIVEAQKQFLKKEHVGKIVLVPPQ